MKRFFISAMTALTVAGTAATAFAAANPFEDVPSDHWAYDAVAQLAADGVIEGYGDGTYRGDRRITRFEMAQMVARAMAKNSGSAADRAMLEKLSAEYAEELNALGVRVDALEKKTDNVKWKGDLSFRYVQVKLKSPSGKKSNQQLRYVALHLNPSMKINEHWTGHASMAFGSDYKTAQNTTSGVPGNRTEVSGARVERIYVEGIYGDTKLDLGRFGHKSIIDGGMILGDNIFHSDDVSGGQVTFGNAVKATMTAGRLNLDADRFVGDSIGSTINTTGSYQGIEVYNDRRDKITWGVGYHHYLNKELNHPFGGRDALHLWEVAAGYRFDKNWKLSGAYAWTPSPQESALGYRVASAAKRAWNIDLTYKGVNSQDKGSFGIHLAYRRLGYMAVLVPGFPATSAGRGGLELSAEYTFMKNVVGAVKYFNGKEIDIYEGDERRDASTFVGVLNFMF